MNRSTTRSFRPSLDRLEDRWCPSCSIRVLDGHILEIGGDDAGNRVIIAIESQQSGEVRVICDDDRAQMFHRIDSIKLRSGNGNDVVQFIVEDPDQRLSFRADLGGGDDQFSAVLVQPGPCMPQDMPPRIAFDVMGGKGNDTYDLFVGGAMAGSPTEAPPCLAAALDVKFDGGDGNDTFLTEWSHIAVTNPVTMDVDGGRGNDMIQVNCGSMSTGDALAPADVIIANTWTGRFAGGGGNDNLISRLLPKVQRGGMFVASFDGGGGNDTFINFVRPAVEADALCLVRYAGGRGNDLIVGATDPTVLGRGVCDLEFDGGPGNDTINELLNLPTLTAGSDLNVVMKGEGGDDHLALLTTGQPDPAAILNLTVDGGPGFDIATIAKIVQVTNCEQVIVL